MSVRNRAPRDGKDPRRSAPVALPLFFTVKKLCPIPPAPSIDGKTSRDGMVHSEWLEAETFFDTFISKHKVNEFVFQKTPKVGHDYYRAETDKDFIDKIKKENKITEETVSSAMGNDSLQDRLSFNLYTIHGRWYYVQFADPNPKVVLLSSSPDEPDDGRSSKFAKKQGGVSDDLMSVEEAEQPGFSQDLTDEPMLQQETPVTEEAGPSGTDASTSGGAQTTPLAEEIPVLFNARPNFESRKTYFTHIFKDSPVNARIEAISTGLVGFLGELWYRPTDLQEIITVLKGFTGKRQKIFSDFLIKAFEVIENDKKSGSTIEGAIEKIKGEGKLQHFKELYLTSKTSEKNLSPEAKDFLREEYNKAGYFKFTKAAAKDPASLETFLSDRNTKFDNEELSLMTREYRPAQRRPKLSDSEKIKVDKLRNEIKILEGTTEGIKLWFFTPEEKLEGDLLMRQKNKAEQIKLDIEEKKVADSTNAFADKIVAFTLTTERVIAAIEMYFIANKFIEQEIGAEELKRGYTEFSPILQSGKSTPDKNSFRLRIISLLDEYAQVQKPQMDEMTWSSLLESLESLKDKIESRAFITSFDAQIKTLKANLGLVETKPSRPKREPANLVSALNAIENEEIRELCKGVVNGISKITNKRYERKLATKDVKNQICDTIIQDIKTVRDSDSQKEVALPNVVLSEFNKIELTATLYKLISSIFMGQQGDEDYDSYLKAHKELEDMEGSESYIKMYLQSWLNDLASLRSKNKDTYNPSIAAVMLAVESNAELKSQIDIKIEQTMKADSVHTKPQNVSEEGLEKANEMIEHALRAEEEALEDDQEGSTDSKFFPSLRYALQSRRKTLSSELAVIKDRIKNKKKRKNVNLNVPQEEARKMAAECILLYKFCKKYNLGVPIGNLYKKLSVAFVKIIIEIQFHKKELTVFGLDDFLNGEIQKALKTTESGTSDPIISQTDFEDGYTTNEKLKPCFISQTVEYIKAKASAEERDMFLSDEKQQMASRLGSKSKERLNEAIHRASDPLTESNFKKEVDVFKKKYEKKSEMFFSKLKSRNSELDSSTEYAKGEMQVQEDENFVDIRKRELNSMREEIKTIRKKIGETQIPPRDRSSVLVLDTYDKHIIPNDLEALDAELLILQKRSQMRRYIAAFASHTYNRKNFHFDAYERAIISAIEEAHEKFFSSTTGGGVKGGDGSDDQMDVDTQNKDRLALAQLQFDINKHNIEIRVLNQKNTFAISRLPQEDKGEATVIESAEQQEYDDLRTLLNVLKNTTEKGDSELEEYDTNSKFLLNYNDRNLKKSLNSSARTAFIRLQESYNEGLKKAPDKVFYLIHFQGIMYAIDRFVDLSLYEKDRKQYLETNKKKRNAFGFQGESPQNDMQTIIKDCIPTTVVSSHLFLINKKRNEVKNSGEAETYEDILGYLETYVEGINEAKKIWSKKELGGTAPRNFFNLWTNIGQEYEATIANLKRELIDKFKEIAPLDTPPSDTGKLNQFFSTYKTYSESLVKDDASEDEFSQKFNAMMDDFACSEESDEEYPSDMADFFDEEDYEDMTQEDYDKAEKELNDKEKKSAEKKKE